MKYFEHQLPARKQSERTLSDHCLNSRKQGLFFASTILLIWHNETNAQFSRQFTPYLPHPHKRERLTLLKHTNKLLLLRNYCDKNEVGLDRTVRSKTTCCKTCFSSPFFLVQGKLTTSSKPRRLISYGQWKPTQSHANQVWFLLGQSGVSFSEIHLCEPFYRPLEKKCCENLSTNDKVFTLIA